MQTTTAIYIVLGLLLSVSVAYFQYFFKVKKKPKIHILLFILKSLSLFLLILLFINPTIKNIELQNYKPILSVLVDNSKSISFFNESENVKTFIENLKSDDKIADKFEFKEFTFGNKFSLLDSVSFNENNTNISEAIATVNELYKDKIAPVILLSDGNQTIGNDYEFSKSKQSIYPVVFGDTIQYKDLKISQLNVNRYSYIKNKFPVEVLLNYEGNESVASQFSIYKNGRAVFTKRVKFSSSEKSKTITTNLSSTNEGLQYYTASIRKIEGEKNIENNIKYFSVEVIDQQTKVLLLSSIIHPDLGTLKKSIETNKQRVVDVFLIDDFKGDYKDYQLVILYQPSNRFKNALNSLNANKSNFLIITGTNTDWNFINRNQLGIAKNAINQSENYAAIFNNGFLTFLQKDIGYNDYPPLQDKFGEIKISKEHQILLFQNINGLETKRPLLITFEENNQKTGALFGEGIWKWRAANFLNTNSFQEFDEFIGNLVQYLASNKKRSRLEVNAETLYPANSSIIISSFYTDKNYQFDARASLEITITNIETKEITKVPFSLINNSYQAEIESLPSGDYEYKVDVLGQSLNKKGRFKITTYQIEEQFTNANFKKMLKLADNSGGKLYYKDEINQLKQHLLENTSFYTTQKSIEKEQNLIDWKWILFIVIALFTVEWLIRKYFGKI